MTQPSALERRTGPRRPAEGLSDQGRPETGDARWSSTPTARRPTYPWSRPTSAPSPASSRQRGCTYAGCKGVVLGPTRDIINITHGPIGCGFYSWLTRRNQTKPPTDDRRELHPLLLLDRHAGGRHRLRRREAAPPGDPGGLRHLPPQGDRRLLDLPGGPDRRRRARRGPRNEGEARHQRLRLQLRGLPRREPVGRAPHRQQRPVQARHRPGRHAAQGQVQRDHARRVQHRRRRLRAGGPVRALRHQSHGHFQRQFDDGQVRERPHGRPERGDVPPLDQLRGRHDPEAVRRAVVQGELHRRRELGQVAPQDRPVLRRCGPDRPGRDV